jgi:dinuclear metal center YbgI/SA1388 family protein
MSVVTRQDFLLACNTLLQPERFRDYGPNGLQVEGRVEIRKLVSGVTASLALIERAIESGADAMFVHHGLFWRGQEGTVTGWMRQRLSRLLAHDINLFAYHLPLDAHPSLGNNAQLGQRLGLTVQENFGEQSLGFLGVSEASLPNVAALAQRIALALGRTPLLVDGDCQRPLKRIAWCSGGAQGYFEAAIAAGADAYITGEISEPQAHLARESGVAFLACGHHATERGGAAAVAAHLALQFGLEHAFIDIDNPA